MHIHMRKHKQIGYYPLYIADLGLLKWKLLTLNVNSSLLLYYYARKLMHPTSELGQCAFKITYKDPLAQVYDFSEYYLSISDLFHFLGVHKRES